MSIPIGRFVWDFTCADLRNGAEMSQVNRVKKIVKQWDGYVDYYRNQLHGESYVSWYSTEGVIRFTLPRVHSSVGLIWYSISNDGEITVTLGPNDTYGRWPVLGSELNLDPYSQGSPIYWITFSRWYYEAPSSANKTYLIYQSYGSNIFTVSRCAYADTRRLPTLGVMVVKGTHLSTGKPSVLVLLPTFGGHRNWDSFSFRIWNPVINNWITGSLSGIKQSLVDSSHILMTPIELNGYSFPNVFFADCRSNPAFSAYCAPEQMREFKYSIKKVNLLTEDYYIPICHSDQTVLLIKHKPDGLTNLQD
jgi:hypothetical protein